MTYTVALLSDTPLTINVFGSNNICAYKKVHTHICDTCLITHEYSIKLPCLHAECIHVGIDMYMCMCDIN